MNESGGERKPKPRNPKGYDIRDFYAKMTPEERKESYRRAAEKRRILHDKNSSVIKAAREKAKDILPTLLAEEILMGENDNYIPRPETLDKLRALMNDGLTMEEMRKRHFKGMSEPGWEKFTKFLFKNHIHHVEDLGLEILTVKQRHRGVLKSRIRVLSKDIKSFRKAKKIIPISLMQMKAEAESELMKLELDVSKTLHSLGAVGDKAKAASIHVHLGNVPRPAPKDVTPAKASLADLLGSAD